jgi:hypothetical protein
VPLTDIGPTASIVEGFTCAARPPRVATSLGPTEQIPVRPGYVYGPLIPPPTAAQMDRGAMAAALNATTPVVYDPDAVAFAVLREDINGKIYLRTMWPQN